MNKAIQTLFEAIPNAKLKAYTTFKVGGSCELLLDCNTAEAVCAAVDYLKKMETNFVLLGGGSNVLVSDAGYSGVVIRYCNAPVQLSEKDNGYDIEAGASLDELVKRCAEKGLSGIKFLLWYSRHIGRSDCRQCGCLGPCNF